MKWVLFALLLPPFGDGSPDRVFGTFDTAEQCQAREAYWELYGSEVYRWTARWYPADIQPKAVSLMEDYVRYQCIAVPVPKSAPRDQNV